MAHRRNRSVALIATLVLVVAIGVAGDRLWSAVRSHFSSDSCSVGAYGLDADQAGVAATMVGEVGKFAGTSSAGLPDRAALLVLMAGLQESKLTNLAAGDGDRDSVGVLQQRPSQGWGGTGSLTHRAAVLTDVGEATREFLVALVRVPHWRTVDPAKAIQAVQISADGSAYTKHRPEADVLASALLGRTPAGISCRFAAPTEVAAPSTVARLARSDLGIDTPAVHGDTVRVPGAHWQTAAWFVAYANRLGIQQVAYDGRRWTRTTGWNAVAGVGSGQVVATMYRASS